MNKSIDTTTCTNKEYRTRAPAKDIFKFIAKGECVEVDIESDALEIKTKNGLGTIKLDGVDVSKVCQKIVVTIGAGEPTTFVLDGIAFHASSSNDQSASHG